MTEESILKHYEDVFAFRGEWRVKEVVVIHCEHLRIYIEYGQPQCNCWSCGTAVPFDDKKRPTVWQSKFGKLRVQFIAEICGARCDKCNLEALLLPYQKPPSGTGLNWFRLKWKHTKRRYRELERSYKDQLAKYIDEKLRENSMGEREDMSTDYAEFSYQIKDRRKTYRRMDLLYWLAKVRILPTECHIDRSISCAPALTVNKDGTLSEPFSTLWKSMFGEAAQLIRHDDALNWSKFNYMLVVFGVIITCWGVAFNAHAWVISTCLALFGVLLAWGADLTFQEGLRCLRAHRRKLAALEKNSKVLQSSFMLSNNAYNQRDVLEAGPTVMFFLTAVLLIASSTQLIISISTQLIRFFFY